MNSGLKYFIMLLLTFFIFCSKAQKKKEIKKYGVKTITSTKTLGARILRDEKLTYNSAGLLIEEIKYNNDGNLASILRYKYNSDEDVIEETEYNEKNVLKEKRTMVYNVLAQKTEERVVNGGGKQIKRFVYTYNSKGLRTEKKTYDAANVLVTTKKIVYGYK
ncbi:hypothetical protein CNR22_19440 [Sphingobacteriaceae bacterium]|nr:hypothetical protein CNR22_19440 [Sphingobacteriaceae bacterium]